MKHHTMKELGASIARAYEIACLCHLRLAYPPVLGPMLPCASPPGYSWVSPCEFLGEYVEPLRHKARLCAEEMRVLIDVAFTRFSAGEQDGAESWDEWLEVHLTFTPVLNEPYDIELGFAETSLLRTPDDLSLNTPEQMEALREMFNRQVEIARAKSRPSSSAHRQTVPAY